MRLDQEPRTGWERGGIAALVVLGVVGGLLLGLHQPGAAGRVVWLVACGDAVRVAPVFAAGRLFAAAEDGHLYAFAADSGSLLWDIAVGEPPAAEPAVGDGYIHLALNDHRLVALLAETGEPAWEARLDSVATASPTLVGELLLVATAGRRLYAFDRRTGVRRWAKLLPTPVTGGPAAAADEFAIALADGTVELRGATGAVVWREAVATVPLRWLQAGPSRLTVAADDGSLIELEPLTGRRLQSIRLGHAHLAPPAVLDGWIYALDAAPRLVAVAPVGGAGWTTRLPAPATARPAVAGDRILVALADRTLRAYDRSTAAEVWRLVTGADLTAPLASDGERVAFGTSKGHVGVVLVR